MPETQSLAGAEMNARAREQNAGRYLLNTLGNLSHLVNGVDPARLRGSFAGVPAIVVGAGPSLDQNISALRLVGDRGLIIAADTAWRPLAAAGVDPHIVVALDPTESNGRHLMDVPFTRAPWVLAEGSVHPPALRELGSRVGVFRVGVHHPWPWLQEMGIDRPLVRVWGSVLTAVYELALTFGCNPIFFAGADLAFTNYQPYCRGTSFERDWAEHTARGVSLPRVWKNTLTARKLLWEPGVDGERALTAPHLIEFRNWIVSRAGEVRDRDTVNTSGAGILQGPGLRQSDLVLELATRAECGDQLRAQLDNLLTGTPDRKSARAALNALVPLSLVSNVNDRPKTSEPLAEWLRFGGPSLTTSAVAGAAVAGREQIAARWTGALVSPTADVEPAAAFLSDDLDIVTAIDLAGHGVPEAWFCATRDFEHAIVTPRDGSASIRIDAAGSSTPGESFGANITGEIPWGTEGGSLAWSRSTRTIFLRRTAGAAIATETVPFEPFRVALAPNGSPVWYAFDGGLWEWLPGSPGRFLIDTPTSGGLIADGTDLVLAPVARDANGSLVRQRLHHEWRYAPGAESLRRVDTGIEGQCINLIVRGEWTTRVFAFSDLIRLDHSSGHAVLLACPTPFGVAWAGPSLLVTQARGRVLLFKDLLPRVEARLPRVSTKEGSACSSRS